MTRSDRDRRQTRQKPSAVSAIVWNAVVPALGLALILGAPLLPAIAIAIAASIGMVLYDQRASATGKPAPPPVAAAA